MRSSRFVAVILLFVVALVMVCDEADARRRGFVIINTGDIIHHVGDLPSELENIPELRGWKLGYMCSHFGILWADVWSWDKQLVLYQDDTYQDIPAELLPELEERYPFSSAERGLWNKYGILIMIAGLVVFGVVKARGAGDE